MDHINSNNLTQWRKPARLTKHQLRQRRDATRDRSRDNTKGTVQYLVTYAYTNNNCLLCASNIIVSVAIPTVLTKIRFLYRFKSFFLFLLVLTKIRFLYLRKIQLKTANSTSVFSLKCRRVTNYASTRAFKA